MRQFESLMPIGMQVYNAVQLLGISTSLMNTCAAKAEIAKHEQGE